MRHVNDFIFDIYIVILSALACIGIAARVGVFFYWWVVNSWISERDGTWKSDEPEDEK